MDLLRILKKNAGYHIAEGALYLSTNALLSTQTLMPALIKRLGGDDVLVGTWPVVVYLSFFLPQVFAANYSTTLHFRKPTVIKRGFIQRLHILILAIVIALWGNSIQSLALTLLFVLFLSNQIVAGTISPTWMDFFVKTIPSENRGRIMGWRASLGAMLGFLNGFILTVLLTTLQFPYNYASAIGLAFILQISSLLVQKKVIEGIPSEVAQPMRILKLFSHLRSIVTINHVFRRFLIASALLTISFSSVAFFVVAAIKRFDLAESVIGIFTIVMIGGQIISGLILGWIADAKGTKSALVICGISLLLAIVTTLLAPSVEWFYLVFALLGVNIGAEVSMRYNFAVDCAPEKDRPMYIGFMNAWFAPFYLVTPLTGWLSTFYGYNCIFVLSLIIGITGIVLLISTPNPRINKLALSSK